MVVVAHGHELDGVGVDSCLVARTEFYLSIVHGKMRWQFRGGLYGVVGNDDVAGAIVEDANHAAIVHRPTCQVTHTLSCSLAEEVLSFQMRQCLANRFHLGDGWQRLDGIVHKLGDVDRDVTSVALCPSVLPQITCHFGYLVDLFSQGLPPVKNAFSHGFEFVFS